MQTRISDKALVCLILSGVLLVAGARMAWAKIDLHVKEQQFQQDMQQMRALGGVDNYNRYLEARAKQCEQ